MIKLDQVKKLSDWPAARKDVESCVLDMLGKLSEERFDTQMRVTDEVEGEGYVRRRVNYFTYNWERVAGWLFVPDGKEEMPAIVCCHDKVQQGKNQTAGIEGDPLIAFARHYAEEGYITFACDCVTSGGRISSGLDAFDCSSFYKDYPAASVAATMLMDHMFAVDVLCETKLVDSSRIGVIGHGLGGTNALLLAAFDDRIQACVSSCGFARFADDKNVSRWTSDDGFSFIPKLKGFIEKKKYPFDWEHILALMAPTPTLSLAALNDSVLSGTKSCQKAVKGARRIYKLLGEADALSNVDHKDGRCVTAETLQMADEWFERWL